MSLIITQRPSTTILTNTCLHSSVGNPIIYKFQREDYQSNTIANSGGNLRITLTGDRTGEILVGASLYYRSDNGVYDGYYTVLTITYSAPDTTITFSGGYTSTGTTGFINLARRLNYKASIQVFNSGLIGTLKISPDRRGVVICDVSKLISSILSPEYDFDYELEVVDETLLYSTFYVKHQGVWIGGSTSITDDVANTFWAVLASRQIRSEYGGFLAEYVSYNVQSAKSPKLLNPFDRPKIWRNLPFNITAIFGSTIVETHGFDILQINPSNATIATRATTPFSLPGRVVSLTPYMIQPIVPTAKRLQIRTDRLSENGLMAYQDIDIMEPCEKAILLQWNSYLGGRAWWCFEFAHELSYTYGNGQKVKRYVLFAENLTLNEWEAINELNNPKEAYNKPIVEFTSDTDKTKAVNGYQVYMHDYIDSEVSITSMQNAGGVIRFNSNTFFSFDNKDIVYINTDVYSGYFFANPVGASPSSFAIGDLTTNVLEPYTSLPTYAQVRRVRKPLGVVVIPTEQTTNTKQEKHSISITIELPETQLA